MLTSDTRVPDPIKPLLDHYVNLIQDGLPIGGLYLLGSIALDAFNERFSDIDFLTVLNRPCTAAEFQQLEQIHRQIAEKYPRWALEGLYLQSGDLGGFDETLSPYPAYHDGQLHRSDHHGADSVMWWLLKTHGITVLGPAAESLPLNVDWDLLISRMHENLNTYWVSFTKNPRRMAWLLTDDGIQWAILGVLRLFYTFKEQDITSKAGAGHYGRAHLPAQWHRIIEEALNIREQRTGTLYRSKIGRANEAVKFLSYLIALCNG